MGPLYQKIMGMTTQNPTQAMPQPPAIKNPIQLMQYAMQVMRNPVPFILQRFPDIPANIQNNPNQILGYLQQTRGLTNQDIQHVLNMQGQIPGQGVVR